MTEMPPGPPGIIALGEAIKVRLKTVHPRRTSARMGSDLSPKAADLMAVRCDCRSWVLRSPYL